MFEKELRCPHCHKLLGRAHASEDSIAKVLLVAPKSKQSKTAIFENKQEKETIESASNSEDLLFRLSALTKKNMVKGKTIIFLGEVLQKMLEEKQRRKRENDMEM